MDHSDNSDSADPKEAPDPGPDRAESAGLLRWLYSLNAFLERAFLEADRATGC